MNKLPCVESCRLPMAIGSTPSCEALLQKTYTWAVPAGNQFLSSNALFQRAVKLESFLIQDIRDMNDCGTDELQYRWFYHLSLAGTPKETWRHGEFAADGTLAIPFDFFGPKLRPSPSLS